ncbi:hypothetical protein CS542_02740 [Pedobacter sp. IW39]|nr:hypothetical protein CS542_02740 [Pedobacter sp. IW39]
MKGLSKESRKTRLHCSAIQMNHFSENDSERQGSSGRKLGYLYKTMIETSSSANYIQNTSKIYKLILIRIQAFANQLKLFLNSFVRA